MNRARTGGRTIDANRILTDLLVNFRRIVHRGLINYSGELWYREGLPSDVFRRLVIRKENETPLDRFSGDYEELITYASFRDLADIIAGNEILRERLSILEPRDGASLLDRLHELEEMRRAVTTKRPSSDQDNERLKRYYEEFRHAIKGGRKAAADERRAATRSTEPSPAQPVGEDETLESIFAPDDSPKPAKRPGRLVVKISTNDLKTVAADPEGTPVTDVSKAPGPPKPTADEAIGAAETPVTEVSVRPRPGSTTPTGPIDEIETVERAILDGDDAVVLKALHVEVTAIADGMLRRDPKPGHPVWELVNRVGWMSDNTDRYGLQPLEIFYTLADEFLDQYASQAKASDLKQILADAGFSKLLLTLREMFLKTRSQV